MGIRILIPCKPLDSGKTRLAAVLPEQERAALCASLLAHTIALAAGIAPTTVVTSDPAVAEICRRLHAQVFAEPPRADHPGGWRRRGLLRGRVLCGRLLCGRLFPGRGLLLDRLELLVDRLKSDGDRVVVGHPSSPHNLN